MADREALYQILDYILNKATSEELGVIAEALKRRASDRRSLGGIDPRGMAENMAKNVKEQLGKIGDIGAIARKMVADLIRDKEPGISDDELKVLLDSWLPGTRPPGAPERSHPGEEAGNLPPDVLITMVSQFVAEAKGTLPEPERRELPDKWRERYWESFSHPTRDLIDAHLHGRLEEIEFWQRLVGSLNL